MTKRQSGGKWATLRWSQDLCAVVGGGGELAAQSLWSTAGGLQDPGLLPAHPLAQADLSLHT